MEKNPSQAKGMCHLEAVMGKKQLKDAQGCSPSRLRRRISRKKNYSGNMRRKHILKGDTVTKVLQDDGTL